MARPAFDPAAFETFELAQINKPLHDPSWDLIEARAAYRAEPTKENHELVMGAREKYNALLAEYELKFEAYMKWAAKQPYPQDAGEEREVEFDFS